MSVTGGSRLKSVVRALALTAALLFSIIPASAQLSVRAVTDHTSYNAGSEVRLKVFFPNSGTLGLGALDVTAKLRYAGEGAPLVDHLELAKQFVPSTNELSTGYRQLWRIPPDAKTGRYEIDLVAQEAESRRVILTAPRAASFAVHRKLVRIGRIQLDRTFYTSGDPVACKVTIENLTDRPQSGLRVEFSDRYWPWIAQSSESAGVEVFTIVNALSLRPGQEVEVRSSNAAVAKAVQAPAVHQYAVVVWDLERKNIHDIAFSSLAYIRPPGVDDPKPYPLQYVYPELKDVNVSSYQHFYPSGVDSGAIAFDRGHTMFPVGSEAAIKFSVQNPTEKPWSRLRVRARLLSPAGAELANRVVSENLTLSPHSQPREEETKVALPGEPSGVYRVAVELEEDSGIVLTTNTLELGVNPLPKSILIFCAHEDDEGAHAGIILAAVENHIPIHLVYFTSGDAGSCDRYYAHSCSPAEALNFGELRMEEARAALGHVGVQRDDIYFLGLPDGGSGEIWYNHLEPLHPYLSVLLASDHAPYEDVARPNLAYARNSAVEAAKEFIKKFQPDVIYTGHPDERHVDHRTNNWFVVKALQELLREGALSPKPTLLTDQVYGPGPQRHAPYHYQKHVLSISGDAMARAQEAGWFYQSQSGNRMLGRLRTFDRLPRSQTHWQILDWQEHEGWNEKP